MSIRHMLAATVAAAGLFCSTTAGAATPASRLSVVKSVRAPAPTGKSKLAAGSTATIISIAVLAGFAAVVLATTDGGGSNSDSP